MSFAIATFATAIAFLAGDAVVIPLVMRPLFKAALGETMLDQLRLGPATMFYLVHIAGLAHFAVRPALAAALPRKALRDGALLGLVAYSCYEMTSWTIMRDWTPALVLIDCAWGMAISAAAAFCGTAAGRWMQARA